jgi:deazaflavin-dependent oxidoreductase (nitroreductase family)
MTDVNDWNATVITDFRANEGRVGGQFEGAPMILVHHTGRKSGTERVNPMMYQAVDGGYAVFASKAGATTNPDWYYNLVANPDTTVEVGSETIPVHAREASADERAPIWTKQKADYPGFADYEKSTDRTIPVIVLKRA